MDTIYHVPAIDQTEAFAIAEAVHAGRLLHREHYLDPAAAQRICDHYERLGRTPRRVFIVGMENRATDDGRINVPRLFDRVGDVAAMAAIFALIPLVGFASLWGILP